MLGATHFQPLVHTRSVLEHRPMITIFFDHPTSWPATLLLLYAMLRASNEHFLFDHTHFLALPLLYAMLLLYATPICYTVRPRLSGPRLSGSSITLRCLLIASTKFSVLEGACIWLVLILAILQVGCLSEIHVYIRIHTC